MGRTRGSASVLRRAWVKSVRDGVAVASSHELLVPSDAGRGSDDASRGLDDADRGLDDAGCGPNDVPAAAWTMV